jgi:hypothetical protein
MRALPNGCPASTKSGSPRPVQNQQRNGRFPGWRIDAFSCLPGECPVAERRGFPPTVAGAAALATAQRRAVPSSRIPIYPSCEGPLRQKETRRNRRGVNRPGGGGDCRSADNRLGRSLTNASKGPAQEADWRSGFGQPAGDVRGFCTAGRTRGFDIDGGPVCPQHAGSGGRATIATHELGRSAAAVSPHSKRRRSDRKDAPL